MRLSMYGALRSVTAPSILLIFERHSCQYERLAEWGKNLCHLSSPPKISRSHTKVLDKLRQIAATSTRSDILGLGGE